MRLGRVLVLLTLVACDSATTSPAASGASSTPRATSSANGPQLCEKAAKLETRLATIDAKAARVRVGSEIALPESKDGGPVSSMSLTVVIGAKDIQVNGMALGRPSDVKQQVQSHGTVLLAIPKGTEGIDRLAEVVAAIGSDRQIYLLAAPIGAKVEPRPKGVDLGGTGANEDALAMVKALTKSIASCPEAKSVFSRLGATDADDKGDAIKKDLPAAVHACGCKVDDDLGDLMAYLLGGDQPVIAKKLNVTSDKSARAIALKGLDGQKLYDALTTDGAAVRFE